MVAPKEEREKVRERGERYRCEGEKEEEDTHVAEAD
jgi:hypothetical protein